MKTPRKPLVLTPSRRTFLQGLGLAGVGVSCAHSKNDRSPGGGAGGGANPGDAGSNDGGRPYSPRQFNVVWIMSDEHNPYAAGYAGDPYIRTPAIDSIAAAGTVFTAGYCQDPICVPSRQSFHSGRMASNIKAGNYESLGTYFSRVGYTSAWYGKQHWETLVNDFHDLGEDPTRVVKARFKDAGIEYPKGDDRLVEHAHTIDWSIELNEETVVTEQSVAFLEAHKNDTTPFFLGVSYVRPHFPFTVQPAYASQYLDMPLPTVLPGMYDDLSAAMKSDFAKYGMGNLTETDLKKCRGVYYGMIDCVDEQVGLVLQKLDELGLREKTIVIYVADHGEMMGQHGIWYKNNYFEGAARVPFIVSMPSSAGTFAKTSDAPVGLIDLFPTLCEACGLAPPDSLEGKRLVPILTGADDGASRVVVSENKRGGEPSRMIRTSDFKYCYYQNGFEQLYKVKSEDRDVEAVNLAADTGYASVKADLKAAALLSWNPDGLSDSDD